MYRRSRKYQQLIERLARGRAVGEKRRMEGHHPDFPPELPELRRLIEITDFDTGTPITHRVELYLSNRIGCYMNGTNVIVHRTCSSSLLRRRPRLGKYMTVLSRSAPKGHKRPLLQGECCRGIGDLPSCKACVSIVCIRQIALLRYISRVMPNIPMIDNIIHPA